MHNSVALFLFAAVEVSRDLFIFAITVDILKIILYYYYILIKSCEILLYPSYYMVKKEFITI